MDRELIYNAIQARLAGNTITPDALELAVAEVEQVILNYCSIPEVPNALRFTLINMTIDLLIYRIAIAKAAEELSIDAIDIADVSGIKVGDTKIDIGQIGQGNSRKNVLNSHVNNLDGIVMNYRAQLNQFRRLW